MVTIRHDGYAEFLFYRPGASRVFLAGDFNAWRADQLRMLHQGNGYWVLRLALPAGDYKFRYVADGLWYTDFAAFGVEPGRFGIDSVIHVPQQGLKLPAEDARPAAAA
jgi:1,4-alpha-glucan branching enzyme